jgi:hypothetical protein
MPDSSASSAGDATRSRIVSFTLSSADYKGSMHERKTKHAHFERNDVFIMCETAH